MKKSIGIWVFMGGLMGLVGCGQPDTSTTDHRSVSEHGLVTNTTREFCDERLQIGDPCDVSDAFCCEDGLVCADMVCVPDSDPQATCQTELHIGATCNGDGDASDHCCAGGLTCADAICVPTQDPEKTL